MQIRFHSEEHRNFYLNWMKSSPRQDSYHRALFYTLGINQDCRNNILSLYDPKEDRIKPDGLYQPWQTSGSECATKLAFNLWNGFMCEGHEQESTPYDLFACEHTPYFFEAIKLRYPEYCRDCQTRNPKEFER